MDIPLWRAPSWWWRLAMVPMVAVVPPVVIPITVAVPVIAQP
jgi:hypothetical protein